MSRCTDDKKNIGISRCNDLPKQFRGMITTPFNFKMTAENALLLATWQTALLAAKNIRIYKWPAFVQNDDAKTDATYEENTLGTRLADPGKYQWRPYFQQDMCTHKAMISHSGDNQRVIFFDGNRMFMMEDEEGNVMGFPCYLNTEKMLFADGAITTKTPVFISLHSSFDVDNYGITMEGKFFTSLNPLTDVELTVDAPPATSADGISVLVSAVCDGVEVSGLLPADFIVKTAAGVDQPVATATEDPDEPGKYFVVGTGDFVAGTITLRAASALTVKGYEAVKPATFAIV